METDNYETRVVEDSGEYPEADRGTNFVDLALPSAAASIIIAGFLWISPDWSLQMVANQLANGHLPWIIGLVAVITNAAISINLLRRRLWTTQGFIEVATLSFVAVVVAYAFEQSNPKTLADTAAFFPKGAPEIFAYSYFVLMIALFLPSVATTVLEVLADRLFAQLPESRRQA